MNKKSLFKKVVAITAAVSIATTGFGMSAFAETKDPQVTVTGGELTPGTIDFSTPFSAQLNGTKQTPTATWDITPITDARGTGEGWGLTLALSPFTEVTTEETLDEGSLTVTKSPGVKLIDDTSSPAETISTINEHIALDNNSPHKIVYTNTTGGGMGSYSFDPMEVQLKIPAKAYKGTYKAEATITFNNVAPQ